MIHPFAQQLDRCVVPVSRVRWLQARPAAAYCLLPALFFIATEAVAASQAKEDLVIRPARLIFYEGSHLRASSYNFIASLPAARELNEFGSTFPGSSTSGEIELAGGPQYGWLQWSRGSYGVAFGASLAETDVLVEESAPIALSLYFTPRNLLFVPSYQYAREEDGSGDSSYLDLYLLYLGANGRSWVSIDPGVQRHYQSRRTIYSFGFEAGRTISSIFGDGGIYARPAVQLEDDRSHEWNLEVGVQINY